jgi:hypothetical protein
MRLRSLLAAIALATLAVATTPPSTASTANRVAAGPNGQAVVVIGNSAHVVQVGGGISGIAALRAVASVETLNYGGGLGEAVCKINGVGDPAVPSSCPGGWRYYRAQNGAGGWTYSGAGPSNTTVRGGDVEGWGYNSTPPFRSFCSVAQCAPPPPPPGQGGAIPGAAFPPPGPGEGGANGGAAPGTPGAPGTEGAPETEGAPADPTATTPAPDTTATDGNGDGKGDGEDGSSSRAARTRLASDDSSGPGSPLSFIVFGVVLVLLVASVFTARWFRRRAALATGGPSEPTKPPTPRRNS